MGIFLNQLHNSLSCRSSIIYLTNLILLAFMLFPALTVTNNILMKILKRISFFFFFFYLWLRWVFVATCGLSLVAASRGYYSLWCAGFSLHWILLLQSTGSTCVGFSSCGTWAQQLCLTGSRAQAQQLWYTGLVAPGMWDLPRPGLEPVSPALAGGFLTTAPPGNLLKRISCNSVYTDEFLEVKRLGEKQLKHRIQTAIQKSYANSWSCGQLMKTLISLHPTIPANCHL